MTSFPDPYIENIARQVYEVWTSAHTKQRDVTAWDMLSETTRVYWRDLATVADKVYKLAVQTTTDTR